MKTLTDIIFETTIHQYLKYLHTYRYKKLKEKYIEFNNNIRQKKN